MSFKPPFEPLDQVQIPVVRGRPGPSKTYTGSLLKLANKFHIIPCTEPDWSKLPMYFETKFTIRTLIHNCSITCNSSNNDTQISSKFLNITETLLHAL